MGFLFKSTEHAITDAAREIQLLVGAVRTGQLGLALDYDGQDRVCAIHLESSGGFDDVN